jgi:hypothetical protein
MGSCLLFLTFQAFFFKFAFSQVDNLRFVACAPTARAQETQIASVAGTVQFEQKGDWDMRESETNWRKLAVGLTLASTV